MQRARSGRAWGEIAESFAYFAHTLSQGNISAMITFHRLTQPALGRLPSHCPTSPGRSATHRGVAPQSGFRQARGVRLPTGTLLFFVLTLLIGQGYGESRPL